MLPTAEGRLQKPAKSRLACHQYLIAYSCKSPSHLQLVLWPSLASPIGLVKKRKASRCCLWVAKTLRKREGHDRQVLQRKQQEMSCLSLPSFWDGAQSHLRSQGDGRPPLLYRNAENPGFVPWHLLLSHPACHSSTLVFK